jgi:type IV secretory pathway VirB10-like protein
MFSRPLAFVLLGLGCVTAAAGGAYVATRQNAAQPVPAIVEAAAAGGAATGTPATAAARPVAETEAPVTAAKPAERPVDVEKPVRATPPPAKPRERAAPKRPAPVTRSARTEIPAERTVPFGNATPASQAPASPAPAAPAPVASVPEQPRPIEAQPVAPAVPQFEEVIVPASSVIGLQLESTLSSERARLEDRVEARVTRDVLAAGRVAIPAGSRVLGSVTLVERGGKVKERARLGVRFHTVILADGNEVPLQTEAIYRDGESPAGDSAKKIGVAAVGGAILGGILGGKKGAAIGGATGAAGGTAAVMSGDRQAALLRGGEIVTARLSSPATVTVERRE